MAQSLAPEGQVVAPSSADRALIAEAERRLRAAAGVHPLAVVPFGSRATGTARLDSDLDLAVIVPDVEYTHEAIGAMYRALQGLGTPVDLLVYPQTAVERARHLPIPALRRALEVAGTSRASL